MKNIFLIGLMGTGKSTVARNMKRKYHMEILEMDETIVEREGMSIPDIFSKKGEMYFRDLETELLKELQEKDNMVVSCGGGVVLREQNVESMKKSGYIVLLTASAETILKRVKHDENRPLLKGKKNVEAIQELMEERREKYESAADIQIYVDQTDSRKVCTEIINIIERLEEKEWKRRSF